MTEFKNVVIKLKELVKDANEKRMYNDAFFYASRLVSLTKNNKDDIYLLAQACHDTGQYKRAVDLLTKGNMIGMDDRVRYLAAKCCAEYEDWKRCKRILDGVGHYENFTELTKSCKEDRRSQAYTHSTTVTSYESALFVLRGRMAEALNNRKIAADCYKSAFMINPFCHEAYEALFERKLISIKDGYELINSSIWPQEGEWLKNLYLCKCDQFSSSFETSIKNLEKIYKDLGKSQQLVEGREREQGHRHKIGESRKKSASMSKTKEPQSLSLTKNNDFSVVSKESGNTEEQIYDNEIEICKAEYQYSRGNYFEAYKISKAVVDRDENAYEALPVFIVCCYEQQEKETLYKTAKALSKAKVRYDLGLYATGMYYMCEEQYEEARGYFSKTIEAKPDFADAKLAYGCAYSAQERSEEALSVFRSACVYFPGWHYPPLYCGMEYAKINNLHLAQIELKTAYDLCATDPFVLTELGYLQYNLGEYDKAKNTYDALFKQINDSKNCKVWSGAYMNLGHVYRKLQEFENAMVNFKKALSLDYCVSGGFMALGLVIKNHNEAADLFAAALQRNPSDTFAMEMMQIAMTESLEESKISQSESLRLDQQ